MSINITTDEFYEAQVGRATASEEPPVVDPPGDQSWQREGNGNGQGRKSGRPRKNQQSQNPDRLPPNSIESEQSVLGCIMRDPAAAMQDCVARLSIGRAEFYDLRHQTIYDTLLRMYESGAPIDIVTLCQTLREKNQLEGVGGMAYVSSLEDIVPSSILLPTYAATLRDKYLRRVTLKLAAQAQEMAYDESIDASRLPEDIAAQVAGIIQSPRPPLPDILDAQFMSENPEPLPDEVIPGLLERGSIMVMGGSSKANKSWTFADLAISVSHGVPWLGMPCNQGNVLYLNLEINSARKTRRIQSIAKAKDVVLEAGRLDMWNLRGFAADYRALLPKIQKRILDRNYSLIILDPIYMIYGDTDENSAEDVNKLLNAIAQFARQTNAAVAFASHFSKGNQASKDPIDRISGSGVFARFPDSILIFTKHEEDNAFTVEATLRNYKPIPPFVVKWDFPLFYVEQELDPAAIKEPKKPGRPKGAEAKSALKFLPPAGATMSDWFLLSTKEGMGVSKRAFYRYKEDLIELGLITEDRATKKLLRVRSKDKPEPPDVRVQEPEQPQEQDLPLEEILPTDIIEPSPAPATDPDPDPDPDAPAPDYSDV